MIQNLIDGVLTGSYISLGAIGLTLVMHILRFANFSHAELLSLGAYIALVCDALVSAMTPLLAVKLAPLSLTGALIVAIFLSMAITGVSAVLIDRQVPWPTAPAIRPIPACSRLFPSAPRCLR